MNWFQSGRRRRLIMPLVILAVAAGLAVWGTMQKGHRVDEVRHLVQRLIDDVAAGRDPSPGLGDTDPAILRLVIATLEAHPPEAVEAVVRTGDVAAFGDGSATHHAVIRIDGVDRLGLRLVSPGDRQELLIVGYWVPQGESPGSLP